MFKKGDRVIVVDARKSTYLKLGTISQDSRHNPFTDCKLCYLAINGFYGDRCYKDSSLRLYGEEIE